MYHLRVAYEMATSMFSVDAWRYLKLGSGTDLSEEGVRFLSHEGRAVDQ